MVPQTAQPWWHAREPLAPHMKCLARQVVNQMCLPHTLSTNKVRIFGKAYITGRPCDDILARMSQDLTCVEDHYRSRRTIDCKMIDGSLLVKTETARI